MNRLDELDRIPFERGQQVAVRIIAEWALDHWGHRTGKARDLMAFLEAKFKLEKRRCKTCKKWKSADPYTFSAKADCAKGIAWECRQCANNRSEAYYERLKVEDPEKWKSRWAREKERRAQRRAA